MTVLRKWLPPVIWMALIFGGSTDVLSGEHTSRFVLPLLRWLFGGHLSPDQLDWGHVLVRKAGHVSEYAVLSILFWLALVGPGLGTGIQYHPSGRWLLTALAWFLAVGYAALDEYHQSFTPSRTANWHDVAIDAGGAAAGLLLVGTMRAVSRSRGSARRTQNQPVQAG